MITNWIISPEFVAILVMLLLIIYVRGSLDSHHHNNRLFYFTLWVSVWVTAINLIGCFFITGVLQPPMWFYKLSQNLFFLITPIMPAFIVSYIITSLNEKIGNNTAWKKYIYVIGILYALYALAVVIDWIGDLGWFFSISADGVYSRGPYNRLTMVDSFLMIALSLIYYGHYRKLVPFAVIKIFRTFAIIVLILLLCQFVFLNLQIAGTSAMLALLIFYMNFHSVALTTDSLTNLPNSEYLTSVLSYLYSKDKRFTIVAINIKGFKRLNQQYGLSLGDRVLKHLGERLMEVPNKLLVCRFTNDRFVLIGPEYNSEKFKDFFDQINFKLEEGYSFEDFYLPLFLDFDVTTIDCPNIAHSCEDAISLISYTLSLSEINFVQARENSHVFYCHCDEKIQQSIYHQEYVHSVLNDAIATGKLQCAYQPIFDRDGNYCGMCEALARLYDSNTNRYIPPSEFIPLAESNGLINKLGKIILLKALDFISDEIKKGNPAPIISINFSFLQFYNANLVDAIIDTIKAYNVPLGSLKIEITESYIINSLNIKEMMERFIASGITFYIDDFGTGYSSFERLFSLPFERAKFDRDIMLAAEDNIWTRKMLSNISSSFKENGTDIIFEGVETEEQLQMVREMGADYIQGYYFSEPIIEFDFSAWVEKHVNKKADNA